MRIQTLLIAVAAAAVICKSALADEVVKLRVSILPIIDTAPLHVALKKDFFAEEKIEVVTAPTSGGAVGIPGLVGGAYDITFGATVSSLLALAQGLDVVVVAPGALGTKDPIVGFKNKAYAGADLEGKTIAVNTRNSIVWLYARAWVQRRGADPGKLTYREVPFPQMEDALRQGLVHAAFMAEPFRSLALRGSNLAVVGDPYAEVQPGTNGAHYVTTRQFATRSPEVLQRFARALRRGVTFYNENRSSPEIASIVSAYTKIPLDTLRDIELPPMPTSVSVEELEKTAALMKAHGMIEAAPNVAGYVLPVALGR